MEEVKRSISSKQETLKKGKPTWKPASLNVFSDMEPGYTYRQSRKDEENLYKKAQEGWENVSGIQSPSTGYVEPGRAEDGKSLTSVTEGRDWILQRIPNELAEARREFFSEKTEKMTAGLRAHIDKDLAKQDAHSHGEITISSRKGTNVL